MIRKAFTGFFFCLCFYASAQKIDSLQSVLDTTKNDRKVKTLNELFRANLESDPELADHFLAEANARLNRSITRLAPDTLAALMEHAWPGNVRELRNMIERAVVVVVGVDVVRDISRVPMDVNHRVSACRMQVRRRQQAGNRNQQHRENRQPPIVSG